MLSNFHDSYKFKIVNMVPVFVDNGSSYLSKLKNGITLDYSIELEFFEPVIETVLVKDTNNCKQNSNLFIYDSDDDIPQRGSAFCFNNDSDEEDAERSCAPSNLTIVPDEYEVSNDCMQDSPYLTQTAKTLMHTISYVSSSDSEKSDSEKEEDDEMPALLPIDSDEESNKNDLTISP